MWDRIVIVVLVVTVAALVVRWLLPKMRKWEGTFTYTSANIKEVVYEPPPSVGTSTKQGRCFRCKQEKEVVLFGTARAGHGATMAEAKKNIVQSQAWCCPECFDRAVYEQHGDHYI